MGAGGVMTSPAGPLGRLRSCSAPLLAALSHYYVCFGKISNVKPLQHPEDTEKGDTMERTAGKRIEMDGVSREWRGEYTVFSKRMFEARMTNGKRLK